MTSIHPRAAVRPDRLAPSLLAPSLWAPLLATVPLAATAGAQILEDAPRWAIDSPLPTLRLGENAIGAGDLNGDGYEDVVLSAHFDGAPLVALLPGGPNGPALGPSWILTDVESDHLLFPLGDVNGDGFADLGIGEPRRDSGSIADTGRARVFFGGPNGLQPVHHWIWTTPRAGALNGSSIVNAGDLDGDGACELIVASPGWDAPVQGAGAVHVFGGKPFGFSGSPDATFEGASDFAGLGSALCGLDLDDDGHSELVASAPGAQELLVIGASAPATFVVETTLAAPAGGQGFGAALLNAGDVNRDGIDDLVVGDPGAMGVRGAVHTYFGRSGGANSAPDATRYGSEYAMSGSFGGALCAVGDLDGDGYDDLAVADRLYDDEPNGFFTQGRVQLLRGGPDGPTGAPIDAVVPAWEIVGTHYSLLGTRVSAVDSDGDGLREVLVAAPGQSAGSYGSVELFGHVRRGASVAWPGTNDDDLTLLTAVGDDTVPTVLDTKRLQSNDTLTVRVESKSGAYVGSPVVVALETHPTGLWGGPVPGLYESELWLDFSGVITTPVTFGALPATGAQWGSIAPTNFDDLGQTWRVQAFAVTPAAPNGLFAATDAHAFAPLAAPVVVFVDGLNGDDLAAGTSEGSAVRTLDRALEVADAQPQGRFVEIRATGGVTYDGTGLVLDRPLRMVGGFDPNDWTRSEGDRSLVTSDHRGVQFVGLDTITVVRGFEFVAADAPSSNPSESSSVAVRLSHCSADVLFDDCRIEAGTGRDGFDGSTNLGTPTSGIGGGNGKTGGLGPSVPGGLGAFSPSSSCQNAGGDGGDGLDQSSGQAGDAPCVPGGGGAGGESFLPPGAGVIGPGRDGDDGEDGADGADGARAAFPLVVQGGAFWTATAEHGEDGVWGRGGEGGGGGCRRQDLFNPGVYRCGGSGGGGAAGGQGGSGGRGGACGGSSIALVLEDSSARLVRCELLTARGGDGGNGSSGIPGAPGGVGGTGGPSLPWQTFAGGDGGDGGHGGHGGSGAGGSGGASIGVLIVGASTFDLPDAVQITVDNFVGDAGQGAWNPNTSSFAPDGDFGLAFGAYRL